MQKGESGDRNFFVLFDHVKELEFFLFVRGGRDEHPEVLYFVGLKEDRDHFVEVLRVTNEQDVLSRVRGWLSGEFPFR